MELNDIKEKIINFNMTEIEEFNNKCTTKKEEFKKNFSIEELKKTSDGDLIYKFFSDSNTSKKKQVLGMFYWLEHNTLRLFGEIGGGSQKGFLIKIENGKESYYQYLQNTQKAIEEDILVKYAKRLKDTLINICDYIAKNFNNKSICLDDYKKLTEKIKSNLETDKEFNSYFSNINPYNTIMLYLHLSFPDYFSCFYSDEYMEYILKDIFNSDFQENHEIENNGLISIKTNELASELNINYLSNEVFAFIINKFYPKKDFDKQERPTYQKILINILKKQEQGIKLKDIYNEVKKLKHDAKEASIRECLQNFADTETNKNNNPFIFEKVKKGTWRLNKNVTKNDISEPHDKNQKTYNGALNQYISKNTIFYGVPGCGKSYYIENDLGIKDVPKDNKKRILFYPDYSYSDFVGQIRPVSKNGNISYDFVPGPFAEILKSALNDKDNNYFLIIEEINRGNAPAIFGDMFQLLDRLDEVGNENSEYPIYNYDVLSYINGNDNELAKDKKDWEIKEVFIPNNLTILATMNTSDQNVFTLDAAFKRRWNMQRINNEDRSEDLKLTWFNNKTISWNDFRNKLNNVIKNLQDGFNLEDKLLGGYFIKASEAEKTELWASKILMYLWNDVVKYDKTNLFNSEYKTLDDLLNAFTSGKNIFNSSNSDLYNLFEIKDNSTIDNIEVNPSQNEESNP